MKDRGGGFERTGFEGIGQSARGKHFYTRYCSAPLVLFRAFSNVFNYMFLLSLIKRQNVRFSESNDGVFIVRNLLIIKMLECERLGYFPFGIWGFLHRVGICVRMVSLPVIPLCEVRWVKCTGDSWV